MIQKNPKQIPPIPISQSKQINELRIQNSRLESQLNKTKQDLKKLQAKYQKSLKQLALIVKANQTLKKDYDELQLKIDSIVQQKAQITRLKIKQHIKKEIDDLNQTIQSLNDQKDKLEMENNSLSIKVKSLGLEKTKVIKEKQEIHKKYTILEAQLQGIDPEARDQNAKSKSVKNLKEKARLVDELQQAVHKLEEEKQSIQKQFDVKLNEIEQLWHEWYEFQHQLNQESQIKLHEPQSQPSSPQKMQKKEQQKPSGRKSRRKSSIIYEHGINLIRGDKSPRKNSKKVHFIHQLEETHKQLNERISKNKILEKQNQQLKVQIEKMRQHQKIFENLKQSLNKLKEEKSIAQQKLSELKIQLISRQPIGSKPFNGTNQPNVFLSPDQDLVSILKDLHSQLGPLRSQLISIKKQQSQQTQITSAEKANTEVKIIRLQKQLTFYKQHSEVLKKQLMQLKSEKQLLLEYESKIKELQAEKSSLEGKLIVMETLKIADRTRVDGETYNALKQFEKRMQILAHDSNILKDLQGNHLQQLIAMKTYILQLDERMKMLQLQNDKITKKYSIIKQKLSNMTKLVKEVQHQQTAKIVMYKEKINAYDKLVSKLTAELEKNIEKNSRLNERQSRRKHNGKIVNMSSSQEIAKVIGLYEQKMINMGEQILRIRKDRDDYEAQVKELRYKINVKIRELNEKQREIVSVKTEVINLQNAIKSLERQRSSDMNNMSGIQKQGSSRFDKSKFASTIVENHQRDDTQLHDEIKKLKKVKENYENEIKILNTKLERLQEQMHNLKINNQQLLRQSSLKERRQHLRESRKEQILENQINKLRQDYESEQIASIELLIQKHNELVNEIRHQNERELQEKDRIIDRIQEESRFDKENLKTLELMKSQLEEICRNKDLEINQLEQLIVKNNQQISHVRNMMSTQSMYSALSSQQQQTQYLHENIQLHNDLYQKNVKITSLQSAIYNLKLEKERLLSDFEIMHEKIQHIQMQLKMKNSAIFNLQNEVRNSSNLKDSTIMAKDSLIRSYENEIKNLKHTIEDLKSINILEKEQLENVVRELKEKLRVKSMSQESIDSPQVNVSYPEDERQQHPRQSLQSPYQQSYSSSIQESLRFISQLQRKIDNLQSQLKNTQQQLLASSQEINRLSNNRHSDVIPSSSSIVSVNNQSEEKIEMLEGQVLTLRTNIFSLQNQIEHKEQIINELRQTIFTLKLENLKSTDKGIHQQEKKQAQPEKHQTQHVDQSTSPRKSPIFMITDQPIIAGLEYQLEELRNSHQELEKKLTQKQMQVNLLRSEIQRLNQIVSKQKVQRQKRQKVQESQQKSDQFETPQKKPNDHQLHQKQEQQNMPHTNQQVQQVIQQLKGYYENELNEMRRTIQSYEMQILNKNLKISQLTRQIVQNRLSSGSNDKINEQQQPQEKQELQNVEYLLQEIQRQKLIITQNQKQSTEIQTLLTKYQSQENRQKENLNLIFLLMVEIESLRSQLESTQNLNKKQQGEMIQYNKIRPVSKQDQEKQQKTQKVDYNVIKALQCSHQHLVNYEKTMMAEKPTQEQQQQSQVHHPITQTIVKSNEEIKDLDTHHRTSSLEQKHIPSASYKSIDEMKIIQATSFPSQSNGSINNIDSNYSIKNPFKDYYRHAQSTYNPLAFSPPKHDIRDSGLSQPENLMEVNLVQIQEEKSKGLMDLGSFGKISQSHNIQSSYGSMGIQSNEQFQEKSSPKSSQYNYNFKNVNMIQSIQSTPSEKGKKQDNQQKQKSTFNNFSFGKEEKYRQQPLYHQVESRYVFEKNNGLSSSSVGAYPYSSYGTPKNYSSSYLQNYPLSSSNQSQNLRTTIPQTFPSFNGKSNLPISTSDINQQKSERSGSQNSSNNYIPTYNSGSSSTISNNMNYATSISNLSQTNFNSTLGNTTSTSYQQYISKFF